jgi:putative ABC transport system permease protein
MWANYLLTLYRIVTRRRLHAALNIASLAAGLAVFLIVSRWVGFETSFERWLPDAQNIYAVQTIFPENIQPIASPGLLLDRLKADYPRLTATRILEGAVAVHGAQEPVDTPIEFVDRDFFKVFDLPWIRGDKATALASPSNLLLSETMARRYFGEASPLGRVLTVTIMGNARQPRVLDYRIVGVFKDLPKNTDLRFDFIAPMPTPVIDYDEDWNKWGNMSVATFLRFSSPEAAAALNASLDDFLRRRAPADVSKDLRYRLVPLLKTHLFDPSDAAAVAAFSLVGLLALLIAGANYVNLATAGASLRAREVGMRKVLGATRPALISQFLLEAALAAALAALASLALAELALPFVNTITGVSLTLDSVGAVVTLVVAAATVALAAGVYPALVLSSWRPAAVLASSAFRGGGRMGSRLREGLIFVQFALAGALAVCTMVVLAQTDFVKHAPLGFRREGLVLVPSLSDVRLSDSQRAALISGFRGVPGVAAAAASDSGPGQGGTIVEAFLAPGRRDRPVSLKMTTIGPDYFKVYDARLLAGRLPDAAHGGDDTARGAGAGVGAAAIAPINVVIDSLAAENLGFASPAPAVGQIIEEPDPPGPPLRYVVIGVVSRLRFDSPREASRPILYLFTSGPVANPVAGIRLADTPPTTAIERLRAVWREIAPNVPFHALTARASLDAFYQSDERRAELFTAAAVLSVLIACLGLFGLSLFSAARRTREIGIRKTLGASTRDVMGLLLAQILRPVAAANLLAWPLAWFAMRSWLSGFDQRIALSPLYFLAAAALTALVAILTVAGQALRVARTEPARALVHE